MVTTATVDIMVTADTTAMMATTDTVGIIIRNRPTGAANRLAAIPQMAAKCAMEIPRHTTEVRDRAASRDRMPHAENRLAR